jgi:anti-sigma regulatory factor (Ser/Thr protein kinase)
MEVRGSLPPGRASAPAAYEGKWRFRVPARDSSVPQVRRAVRALLAERGVPIGDELLHDLLLIVSELVTNAVRHAAVLSPEMAVEVVVGADRVRIGVEDNHPCRPKALETDHGRTGGRGLRLVKTITGAAGGSCDADRTATGGKVVWAQLPLRPCTG